jgi:excisionase family DNA binding protein
MAKVMRTARLPAQRPRWCSVAHAAQLFDVSEMTLYRAIRNGRFPAVRIMGRLVVSLAAIDAMEQAAAERHAVVDAAEWVEHELVNDEEDRPRPGANQYGVGSFSTQHVAGYGEDATPAARGAVLGGDR